MHNTALKGLYVITDETLTPDHSVSRQVKEALDAGASIVQYRNKSQTDDAVEATCVQLLQLCRKYHVPFIIDDRPYLARKIDADGLHIGRGDMPLTKAREIFPNGIIGVSCYGSLKKAIKAQKEGANYVAFGSFFPSPTKPHSGVVSPKVLSQAKALLDIPICAIGGINQENIQQIASTKSDMIALVSAVFKGDIQHNISNLHKGMTHEN